MVNTETWITREEAGAIARVNIKTIDAWRRQGRLPFTKIFNTVRIRQSDLVALMEKGTRAA